MRVRRVAEREDLLALEVFFPALCVSLSNKILKYYLKEDLTTP